MIVGSTPATSISVIICAYTEKRWAQLVAGCRATLAQLGDGDECVIVIDHADALEARAQRELVGATVVGSTEEPGLSGARNTGVAVATGEVVVFLDDDACPEPGWLAAYRDSFADPRVAVVSGAVEAAWVAGGAPTWFPAEFGWVVGCDYRGVAADGGAVRNPIGANMGIRRSSLEQVGGFAREIGRVGTHPVGDEETDLCIRIRQGDPSVRMVRNARAVVKHSVPTDRGTLRYFVNRCFYEGRSKAVLSRRVGSGDGLASERTYSTQVLPMGVVKGLRDGVQGRSEGPARAGAIVVGFSSTVLGYVSGWARTTTVRPLPVTSPVASVPQDALALSGDWFPLVVTEYPLGATDRHAGQNPGSRTRLMVTADGSPVGFLDLEPGESVPPSWVVAGQVEIPQTDADTFSARTGFTPSVSVIIPSRARSFELVRCVRSVLAVDYPDFEVIVVDNNDRAGTVAELLAPLAGDVRLRILHQPERGVSPARNLGIVEAEGEIIAATDDDVVVSRQWLAELVAPFVDPEIACVTGLVVPNGFSSPAQEMFEEFGGFSKGFVPRRYDLRQHRSDHVLYPYSPGIYGSGNNVAYRRGIAAAVGGYDPRLGPGTHARAGEDLDLFLKVLFDGGAIYYQPRAWVRHHHRDTVGALRDQLRDYGRGLACVMVKWALYDRQRAMDIALRLPAGLRHLLDPRSDKNDGRTEIYPPALRRSEMRGLIEGMVLGCYDRLAHGGGRRSTEPLSIRHPDTPDTRGGLMAREEVGHHAG